jgi:gliding motility-associated-like protein
MDNPINPDPVWTFNLTNPIQPGQTRVITTPVFDVPLPANATEWPFWDDLTGPNGWPNSNYGPLMLYMNGCFLNSVTLNSFLPLSDDCPNIDGDQFCDCNVEVYDFRTEPELEMDLVIHSDYNCHPSSFPPGSTNYTQNNPSIDHIVLGIKSLSVNNNCGSSLYGYVFLNYPWTHFPEYSLGDTITLQVDQAANYPLYTCLQPAIAAGHYDNCVEAVLWQLNNSYNLLGNVNNPEITMDDNIFIINSGCPTVANTTDLGINSFTYDVIGCDVGAPYAAMDITVVNQGTTVINDFCLNLDILPDGLPSAQYCFQNLNLLPGQSYVVEVNGAPLANGVTSLSISTTGDSGLSNNSFVGTINLPCYGCTLTSAVNYNPYATVDDGTCIPTVLGCTDELANNYNPIANVDNGSCTYDVFGCTDSSANNFNPEANVDNGSCTYDVFGCTDSSANNFNPNANINDGSCTYDVFGCTDPLANNFNPDANVNDSSCTYDVYGCTDSSANNFNPEANVDNGSCTYDVFGCTDSSANNFNPEANVDNGSCTYDVYGCTDSSANNFNPNANINDGSCTYDVFGCTDSSANNFNPNANINDGSCTYDVYGCTDSSANNFNPDANVDNGSCTYDVFGCTDSDANNFNPNANIDDGSCTYNIFGCTDVTAFNYNPNANVDNGSCLYEGCTNPQALNYDPNANLEDGTCIFAPVIDECDDVEVFVPNAFTPNNDGINDAWYVVTNNDCWLEWTLRIYNRWGGLIWETNDPNEKWIGNVHNGDYYVSDGLYVYQIIAKGEKGRVYSNTGNITVLR